MNYSFNKTSASLSPLKISESIYKLGQSSAWVDGRCIFNTSDAKNSSASVWVVCLLVHLCVCVCVCVCVWWVLLVGFDFDVFPLAELAAIFVPVEGGARVAHSFTLKCQPFTFQEPLRIHGLHLRSWCYRWRKQTESEQKRNAGLPKGQRKHTFFSL